MDTKALAEILETLKQSGFAEVELDYQDWHLHVRQGTVSAMPTEPVAASSATAPQVGETVVKSPLVGIMHLADEQQQSFVTVGQTVEKGTILGQVESMKLFNEIKSPVAGKVQQILVKDRAGVAYDAPLFVLQEVD